MDQEIIDDDGSYSTSAKQRGEREEKF